eukprot:sb/3464137/
MTESPASRPSTNGATSNNTPQQQTSSDQSKLLFPGLEPIRTSPIATAGHNSSPLKQHRASPQPSVRLVSVAVSSPQKQGISPQKQGISPQKQGISPQKQGVHITEMNGVRPVLVRPANNVLIMSPPRPVRLTPVSIAAIPTVTTRLMIRQPVTQVHFVQQQPPPMQLHQPATTLMVQHHGNHGNHGNHIVTTTQPPLLHRHVTPRLPVLHPQFPGVMHQRGGAPSPPKLQRIGTVTRAVTPPHAESLLPEKPVTTSISPLHKPTVTQSLLQKPNVTPAAQRPVNLTQPVTTVTQPVTQPLAQPVIGPVTVGGMTGIKPVTTIGRSTAMSGNKPVTTIGRSIPLPNSPSVTKSVKHSPVTHSMTSQHSMSHEQQNLNITLNHAAMDVTMSPNPSAFTAPPMTPTKLDEVPPSAATKETVSQTPSNESSDQESSSSSLPTPMEFEYPLEFEPVCIKLINKGNPLWFVTTAGTRHDTSGTSSITPQLVPHLPSQQHHP